MPTYRQKLVASKLVENGGNIGKAMISAGYSPATAKTPKKLTQSKGWKILMDRYIPDDLVVETHKDALQAHKIDQYIFPKSYFDKEIKELIENFDFRVIWIKKEKNCKRAYFLAPDHSTRMLAVKEAYKIKDKYPREKVEQKYNEEAENFFAGIRRLLPSENNRLCAK